MNNRTNVAIAVSVEAMCPKVGLTRGDMIRVRKSLRPLHPTSASRRKSPSLSTVQLDRASAAILACSAGQTNPMNILKMSYDRQAMPVRANAKVHPTTMRSLTRNTRAVAMASMVDSDLILAAVVRGSQLQPLLVVVDDMRCDETGQKLKLSLSPSLTLNQSTHAPHVCVCPRCHGPFSIAPGMLSVHPPSLFHSIPCIDLSPRPSIHLSFNPSIDCSFSPSIDLASSLQ